MGSYGDALGALGKYIFGGFDSYGASELIMATLATQIEVDLTKTLREAFQAICKLPNLRIFKREDIQNIDSNADNPHVEYWESQGVDIHDNPIGLNVDALKFDLNEFKSVLDTMLIAKDEAIGVGGGGVGRSQFNYIRWDLLCEIINNFVIDKNGGDPVAELSYLNDSQRSPDDGNTYLEYSSFKFNDSIISIVFFSSVP